MHRRECFLRVVGVALGPGASHSGAQPARADFLRLIDRDRAPLTPEVSALPARARFARERFAFATEAGQRVPGLAVKLAGSTGRRPAVVVLHGTGDSKEGMAPLLEALAELGFLAVAIDGRHHGEARQRPGRLSAGNPANVPNGPGGTRSCTTPSGTPCGSSTISKHALTSTGRASD